MRQATRFEVGACTDLGMFDPTLADCGVAEKLAESERVIDWLVLMEDRSPDFFHGYRGFDAEASVPLNRHGPNAHAWTHADLKRLVDTLRAEGVAVFLGYWVHESDWVDEKHPELLIRDATGRVWQNRVELNADFNPMRHLEADEEAGIDAGTWYPDFAVAQYRKLQADFGFDGLFLGDGAMGFRRHGHDWKDLRHFDYDDRWLERFTDDDAFAPHRDCALGRAGATTEEKAADVHAHHWAHWVAWNTDQWTGWFKHMADAVHATGGELAAYNCMNYEPAQARLHGVDYRAIAEAGLDVLVHQSYDYAWGPLGPFTGIGIGRKGLDDNLASILATRAHIGADSPMRMVVSVETEDEVEHWDAPEPFTLGELHTYANAALYDAKKGWRRALDGGFIVWANSVKPPEWARLADAFRTFTREPVHTPAGAIVWPDGAERALEADALKLQKADELYAHYAAWTRVGAPAAPGIVHAADVEKAFPAAGDREPVRAQRS